MIRFGSTAPVSGSTAWISTSILWLTIFSDLLLRPVCERHPRGVLKASKHHAYLLAELVDEDGRGLRAIDGAGELPQRLGHQPGLKADVRITHVAFEFGPGGRGPPPSR